MQKFELFTSVFCSWEITTLKKYNLGTLILTCGKFDNINGFALLKKWKKDKKDIFA